MKVLSSTLATDYAVYLNNHYSFDVISLSLTGFLASLLIMSNLQATLKDFLENLPVCTMTSVTSNSL